MPSRSNKTAEDRALAEAEARDRADSVAAGLTAHREAAERAAEQPFDEPKRTVEESPIANAAIHRTETAPGVFEEITVVSDGGVRLGGPPLAATVPDYVGDPRPTAAPERLPREVVGAEPPTVVLADDRRRVTAAEINAPAVRAATASAQANLGICLLRAGDRVAQPVECVDIHDPGAIIELQAGAVVPEGKTLIPANLVNLWMLAD
jgi:hypothetical protein